MVQKKRTVLKFVFRISVFCGFKVNGQREVLHSTVYVDLTTKMYNLRMHAVM